MTSGLPYVKTICRLLALAMLFAGGLARGQNVVLHLRNGDRIAGTVLSENTNQLVLSNTWISQLTIPVAQIERFEIILADTNVPPVNLAGTNLYTPKNLLSAMMPPAPNSNTFWKRWKGEAAVGADFEKGATDHQLFYGKASITYSQPYESDPKEFFRNIFTLDAAYGKSYSYNPSGGGNIATLTDNRIGGSSKTDFDLSRRIYLYNLGAAYYDEIRKINRHYEDGPGVGYHWFNQTNFAVNLELGANYQVEDRSDGTRTYSAYYRLGQDLMWKPTKQMTITEKFEFFPRVGYATQYRMRVESNIAYALLWHLTWNFSVVDYYDTQPATGIPNNDLQLRTSLGVKF